MWISTPTWKGATDDVFLHEVKRALLCWRIERPLYSGCRWRLPGIFPYSSATLPLLVISIGAVYQNVRSQHDPPFYTQCLTALAGLASGRADTYTSFTPASRYSTAIRMATPFSTWPSIIEWSESATSLLSSTPLLMGPGCMITISLFRVSSSCLLMP